MTAPTICCQLLDNVTNELSVDDITCDPYTSECFNLRLSTGDFK